MKELAELAEQDDLNYYEKNKVKTNWVRFKEITNYNFQDIVIKKNVGDQLRTFLITNQSKPLLSPSRLASIFNEHIFWNIPKRTLLLPRLMGQLIHKFLELRIKENLIIKLTNENLEEYAGGDYHLIKEEWTQEKINLFMDDVNEAVDKIYNYLNQKKIKIVACEKYVCNDNYHGYIDLVGYKWFNNEKSGEKIPMIIDLKITTNDEIINSYYAQLSIYRQIYEKTAQCYILFYDRNKKTPRLEKASWSKLDEVYEAIDRINKLYRGD